MSVTRSLRTGMSPAGRCGRAPRGARRPNRGPGAHGFFNSLAQLRLQASRAQPLCACRKSRRCRACRSRKASDPSTNLHVREAARCCRRQLHLVAPPMRARSVSDRIDGPEVALTAAALPCARRVLSQPPRHRHRSSHIRPVGDGHGTRVARDPARVKRLWRSQAVSSRSDSPCAWLHALPSVQGSQGHTVRYIRQVARLEGLNEVGVENRRNDRDAPRQ